LGVKPVEEKEVESYYREDAFIWSFYLSARRLDGHGRASSSSVGVASPAGDTSTLTTALAAPRVMMA